LQGTHGHDSWVLFEHARGVEQGAVRRNLGASADERRIASAFGMHHLDEGVAELRRQHDVADTDLVKREPQFLSYS